MDSNFFSSVGFASISSGNIVPSTPISVACMNTHGFPASIHVALIPSKTSMMFPVGSSFPVFEPL
jgi:hypothetical protein